MSHQDDKYHRHAQLDAWEHLLGYAVLDRHGEKIGTIKALWEDYTRQPAYLGVATSWLDMGRIHLVPAQFGTVSGRQKCVRLSIPAEAVKGAPECHATDEITLSGETKIRDYYRKTIGAGSSAAAETRELRLGDDRRLRENKPVLSEDWSPRDRREDRDESRSFKERVRDAVDEGKAKLSQERNIERPETSDRAEREMGLPFEESPTPLRKIYRDPPVAEPVHPREEEDVRPRHERAEPRDDGDFVPLRGDSGPALERIDEEEDEDLPLR